MHIFLLFLIACLFIKNKKYIVFVLPYTFIFAKIIIYLLLFVFLTTCIFLKKKYILFFLCVVLLFYFMQFWLVMQIMMAAVTSCSVLLLINKQRGSGSMCTSITDLFFCRQNACNKKKAKMHL